MAISGWLCISNTKSMFVKIVHPGGHVELHDRPILAVEVMLRNPKCCVAYPNVFKQPTAIVPPDATLLPGQKFYVVPVRTIRKLQRSSRHSPSPSQDVMICQHAGEHDNMSDSCCLLWNMNSPKQPYACLEQPNSCERTTNPKDDSCFTGLLKGINIKPNSRIDSNRDSTSSNSPGGGSSEARICTTKKSDHCGWQPSLQSITEEKQEF